jgi:hypothetical protein
MEGSGSVQINYVSGCGSWRTKTYGSEPGSCTLKTSFLGKWASVSDSKFEDPPPSPQAVNGEAVKVEVEEKEKQQEGGGGGGRGRSPAKEIRGRSPQKEITNLSPSKSESSIVSALFLN